MITQLNQLEAGLYQEARARNLNLTALLEDMARKGEISGDLIRLDSEAPTTTRGVKLDPFQQLLRKGGIRTKGPMAATGDAFFSNSTNKVLFPEFVSREYRDAEKYSRNLVTVQDLVATRQGIDGVDYRAGVIEAGQEAKLELGKGSQGGELARYTVKLADRAITLSKYGGILEFTYESVRRARIPVLSRFIFKVARAEGNRKAKAALEVAVNGDGNSNPAANTATAGANWAFADLVDIHIEALSAGIDPGILIGDGTEMAQILKLSTWTADGATAAGAGFRDDGNWPMPLGMVPKLAPAGSVLSAAKKALAFDRQVGLEEVFENGSEIVEADRLITTQFQTIAFSEYSGFAKPDKDAGRTKTRP